MCVIIALAPNQSVLTVCHGETVCHAVLEYFLLPVSTQSGNFISKRAQTKLLYSEKTLTNLTTRTFHHNVIMKLALAKVYLSAMLANSVYSYLCAIYHYSNQSRPSGISSASSHSAEVSLG